MTHRIREQARSHRGQVQKSIRSQNKRPRICEAFYLGFNLFNFVASILEKVRT
jgi:hypothetical protein